MPTPRSPSAPLVSYGSSQETTFGSQPNDKNHSSAQEATENLNAVTALAEIEVGKNAVLSSGSAPDAASDDFAYPSSQSSDAGELLTRSEIKAVRKLLAPDTISSPFGDIGEDIPSSQASQAGRFVDQFALSRYADNSLDYSSPFNSSQPKPEVVEEGAREGDESGRETPILRSSQGSDGASLAATTDASLWDILDAVDDEERAGSYADLEEVHDAKERLH